MKRTMIVSAFTGCGKTFLAKGKNCKYVVKDSDSSTYVKDSGWADCYVSNVMEYAKTGKYDFIFICMSEAVLKVLCKRGIPYVIVEPDNIVWNEYETPERKKERQLIKQQWFGRLCLRDNSFIKDFTSWFSHIKEIYDERTSLQTIDKYKPVSFFCLNQNEYLSDIIDDLYWKKEHCSVYDSLGVGGR